MKTSIIIPIYNAQDTLSFCIDSILNQAYQDYELILINDGSTDNSQKIIEKYKKKYPKKIKVFIQKNSGIAITRNNGIQYSSGKYLFFIDNDDYIDSDYIQTFIEEIERRKCDVLIGGYRRVSETGKILYQRIPLNTPWSKYMFITPWGRIYKKDSLRKENLSFLNLNIGEDVGLNINANLKLKVETIPYVGYNWVDKQSSTSNTLHKGMKKDVDIIPLFQKIFKDSESVKFSNEEKTLFEYFILKTAIYYILHSGRKTEFLQLKLEKEKIFNCIKEYYPLYDRNKNISPLRPKGEAFSIRIIIYFYILLQKLHLENAFLWVYSNL